MTLIATLERLSACAIVNLKMKRKGAPNQSKCKTQIEIPSFKVAMNNQIILLGYEHAQSS